MTRFYVVFILMLIVKSTPVFAQITLDLHVTESKLMLVFENNTDCDVVLPFSLANLRLGSQELPILYIHGINSTTKEITVIDFKHQAINWENLVEYIYIKRGCREIYKIDRGMLNICKGLFDLLSVTYKTNSFEKCAQPLNSSLNLISVKPVYPINESVPPTKINQESGVPPQEPDDQ